MNRSLVLAILLIVVMASVSALVYYFRLGFDVWAVIIATSALIVTLLKDFIAPFFFKPDITIEGKNDDECVQMDTDRSRSRHPAARRSRWLRLRLRNNDSRFSTTAKNCYVKLIEISNNTGQKVTPFNPFPLMWVQYSTSSADLSKDEEHLVNLAFEHETKRIICPAVYGKFELPNDLAQKAEEKLGPGIYIFKVKLYGDNFDSISKEFKVKLTNEFGGLKFVK